MRVKVIEKEVMNPLGETAADKIEVMPVPEEINKISYFDNTKPNADVILASIAESLNMTGKKVEKPAGAGATDEQLNDAADADLSIIAVGDCGSCSTWVILDAIRLEKKGTPTISICSDNFMDYARSLAKSYGADDLRIVEIKHPISGQKEEDVRKKARETTREIKKILNID
ncbi:UGSC family (seleno)protein [Methanobacterium sp.]|uniref:UGSC family (seleno)protein n=1 Tax=Methanobacterium sp. TaxID=2164 RepID=UPI003C734D96